MPFFFGGGGASVSNMVGATSSVAGTAGLVPAPAAGDQDKVLLGNATFEDSALKIVPPNDTRRSGGICYVSDEHSSIFNRTTKSGFLLFAPMYVRKTKAYTTFNLHVTGAGPAGAVGKCALYSISSSAAPDALLVSSGTFTADSTGVKQPTFSSTVIKTGWYYVAVATNGATDTSIGSAQYFFPKSFISGMVSASIPIMLSFSQKAYADLWPDPWSGTDSYQSTAHPIIEVT